MSDLSRLGNHATAAQQPQDPDALPPDADASASTPDKRLSAAELAALAAAGGAVPDAPPPSGAGTAPLHDAPPLPDVQGPRDPDGAAQVLPAWLRQKPYSYAECLDLLSSLAADYQIQSAQAKRQAGQATYQQQVQGVDAVRTQVQGEREAAGIKLGVAVAAVGISAVAAGGGAVISGARPQAFEGAALQASGQMIGNLVNAVGESVSKLTPGVGQNKADEARIMKAVLDVLVAQDKATEDAMSSTVDQARKASQALVDWKRSIDDKRDAVLMGINNNV